MQRKQVKITPDVSNTDITALSVSCAETSGSYCLVLMAKIHGGSWLQLYPEGWRGTSLLQTTKSPTVRLCTNCCRSMGIPCCLSVFKGLVNSFATRSTPHMCLKDNIVGRENSYQGFNYQ